MPKKLCVFSDGSGSTLDQSSPTNIATLARAVKHVSAAGEQQLVFYDPGVGTEGNRLDRQTGFYFGEGLDLNIRQLYLFLALNYEPGDAVLLFGFSRGAYTVRSLAGVLRDAGLLTRENITRVDDAYELYRSRKGIHSPDAVDFRARYSQAVDIHLLACFDTVGALGNPIPALKFLDGDRYLFHNITLAESIQNAIHVVCIDEDRKSFEVILMEPHSSKGAEQLTQLYLPGGHSGVGGGDPREVRTAANALKFLVDEMERRGIALEFDMAFIPKEYDIDIPPMEKRPFFSMHNVMKTVAGEYIRDIKSLSEMHETVFERYKQVPTWRPRALDKWKDQLLASQ